jgi:hypothetical protein
MVLHDNVNGRSASSVRDLDFNWTALFIRRKLAISRQKTNSPKIRLLLDRLKLKYSVRWGMSLEINQGMTYCYGP